MKKISHSAPNKLMGAGHALNGKLNGTHTKPQLTFIAEIGKMVGLELNQPSIRGLNQLSIIGISHPLPQIAHMRRRKELSLSEDHVISPSRAIPLPGTLELQELPNIIQAVTLMPHPALLLLESTSLVKTLQVALFVLKKMSFPSLQLGADKHNLAMSMELEAIFKTPQGTLSQPELTQLLAGVYLPTKEGLIKLAYTELNTEI